MNYVQQNYIEKKLNPVLEEVVEKLMTSMPSDAEGFVYQWLLDKKAADEALRKDDPAAQSEVQALEEENMELEAHIQSVQLYCAELERVIIEIAPTEEEVYAAPPDQKLMESAVNAADGEPAAASEPSDDDDEDEDDDDVCEDMPDIMSQKKDVMAVLRPRTSVSAEAYGAWNKKEEYVATVYPKTAAQREALQAVLKRSFMFQSLKDENFSTVLDAIKELNQPPGIEVIKQGEDGDCLYIIGAGVCDCYRFMDGEQKLVKTVKEGDVFGELALLYNCPRAATVKTREQSKLYMLDRNTFNHIVRDSSQKERERNEEFVKKVKLFSCLDSYDRCRMAECLRPETYAKGDKIIQIGDAGDRMYFVDSGELIATKPDEAGGADKTVMQYKPGDYFGEISILRNKARQANIIAKTDATIMALMASDFRRLFGSLAERMKEHMSQYAGLKA